MRSDGGTEQQSGGQGARPNLQSKLGFPKRASWAVPRLRAYAELRRIETNPSIASK